MAPNRMAMQVIKQLLPNLTISFISSRLCIWGNILYSFPLIFLITFATAKTSQVTPLLETIDWVQQDTPILSPRLDFWRRCLGKCLFPR